MADTSARIQVHFYAASLNPARSSLEIMSGDGGGTRSPQRHSQQDELALNEP